MSEEGTGSKATDGDLQPDLNLKSVAKSIAEVRAWLKLRQTVGSELRAAIKRLLGAQERLEGSATMADLRLDLLEAVRIIGAVETLLKTSELEENSDELAESPVHHAPSPEVVPRIDAARPPDRSAGVDPAVPEHPTPILDPSPRMGSVPQQDPVPTLGAVRPSVRDASQSRPAQRGFSSPSSTTPTRDATAASGTGPREQVEGESDDSLNRRGFRRRVATYPIQLQAPYDGFSNSNLTKLPISGITLNVSRGGMLAQIDQGILRHGRYLIRFLGAGQDLRPEIVWGRVRRSRAADNGWEVGIEFDSPLDILRP